MTIRSRRLRRRKSGQAVEQSPDKTERFVLIRCTRYLKRHFEKYPINDRHAMGLMAWCLGQAREDLSRLLLSRLGGMDTEELEEDLSEAFPDHEEYGHCLWQLMRKIRPRFQREMNRRIPELLDRKAETLSYRGKSQLEKNLDAMNEMFGLTELESEFCIFVYILSNYDPMEEYFVDRLECQKLKGRRYLSNALDMTQGELNEILSGKLEKIGLFEMDRNYLSLEDDFRSLFENPSSRVISENFFVRLSKNRVPLDHHFVGEKEKGHILNLLREKPETSTHLLLYGPPGTGKSELARYMGDHLNREVITRRISDIQSKWVGESEHHIREAFETAEREEAILVIDEVDSLLFSRDRAVRSWEISLTNEFLTSMERFRGILICTSNRMKDLDEAAIRRFNHKLGFGYLTGEGNVVFYKRLLAPLAGSPLSPDTEACLKDITHLAPGDFKTVKDRYAFYQKREVTHQIMVQALAEEAGIKKIHRGETAIGF